MAQVAVVCVVEHTRSVSVVAGTCSVVKPRFVPKFASGSLAALLAARSLEVTVTASNLRFAVERDATSHYFCRRQCC